MEGAMNDELPVQRHILIVVERGGSWSKHPEMTQEQALAVLEAVVTDYRRELGMEAAHSHEDGHEH